MKRASLFVLGGAAAGFAGVLVFHTRPATSAALAGTGTPAGGKPAARGARAGNGPAAAGSSAPSAGPTAASSSAAAGAVRSATGTGEQYGYGVLAVRVTVRGSHITDVTVTTNRTAEPTSTMIAQQALPMLRSE